MQVVSFFSAMGTVPPDTWQAALAELPAGSTLNISDVFDSLALLLVSAGLLLGKWQQVSWHRHAACI